MGLIYHLFCTVTGKAYVGQTWETLEKRWQRHCKPSSCCIKLFRAIQKYGPSAFVRSVLTQDLTTQEQMDAAEKYWIKYFDTIQNGYNLKEGGSHGRYSFESRMRMRERKLGLIPSNLNANHLAMKGVRQSPEWVAKRAEGKKRAIVDQFGVLYRSQRDAADLLGIPSGAINRVVKGLRSHTHGYQFRYVEVADGR